VEERERGREEGQILSATNITSQKPEARP
jgi:hypothetical protein